MEPSGQCMQMSVCRPTCRKVACRPSDTHDRQGLSVQRGMCSPDRRADANATPVPPGVTRFKQIATIRCPPAPYPGGRLEPMRPGCRHWLQLQLVPKATKDVPARNFDNREQSFSVLFKISLGYRPRGIFVFAAEAVPKRTSDLYLAF